MNITSVCKKIFCLGSVLALAACTGQPSSPIAFKTVTPLQQDEAVRPESQTSTLSTTLLDSVVKQGVPLNVATESFAKYDQFQSQVKNTAYITMIDFTQFSGKPRLYMVNTSTGAVDALLVAHGSGSDPNATGTPSKFSNIPNSKMSSLGAYLVSETAQTSDHGTIARLDGLESTNNLARPRAIILHSATYVNTSLTKMGMSWGCPAISLDWIARALQRLPGGSFMYAYGPPQNTAVDDIVIRQIMLDPAYHWVNEFESAPAQGE